MWSPTYKNRQPCMTQSDKQLCHFHLAFRLVVFDHFLFDIGVQQIREETGNGINHRGCIVNIHDLHIIEIVGIIHSLTKLFDNHFMTFRRCNRESF